MAEGNKMKYFKISAYNNIGVQNLFRSMAEDILKSLDAEKLVLRSESIKLGYLNNQCFNCGNNDNNNVHNNDQNNEYQRINTNGSNNYLINSQCCKI